MAEITSALGSVCVAMAEVTRALAKIQSDTDGGRVRVTYEMAVERNKAVCSFTVEIGDGVTKAEIAKELTARTSTGEIGVNKAGLENKEAARTSTGEIGINKAGLGNKEAARTSTGEVGVNKAGMAAKTITAAAHKEMVTWSEQPRDERTVLPLTKERVPEVYIESIKANPQRRIRLRHESLARRPPEIREQLLASCAHIDYLVDLQQDCLRQHAEKGYAEIGVEYSAGFKRMFILPQDCQKQFAEKGYAEIRIDYPDGSKVFILPKTAA